jgi:hypothetical protein
MGILIRFDSRERGFRVLDALEQVAKRLHVNACAGRVRVVDSAANPDWAHCQRDKPGAVQGADRRDKLKLDEASMELLNRASD